MKISKVYLLIAFIALQFGTAIAQNIKFNALSDTESKAMKEKRDNTLNVISYSQDKGELIFDKGDGNEIKKIVKLDESGFWDYFVIKNNIYFFTKTYNKKVLNYDIAIYNTETFKLGSIKRIFTVESPSDPRFYSRTTLISENSKFIAFLASPGKLTQSSTSSVFTSSSKSIIVFNPELEVLYQKEIAYEFDSKEFEYDVANILSDDGSWYWFGMKYSGKGDSKTSTYGYYTTNPEGNTAQFKQVGFEKNYISSFCTNTMSDDKIIQCGLWSNTVRESTVSGTFYLEIDLKSGKINNQQFTTFTVDELTQLSNYAGKNRIEKDLNVRGMKYVWLRGETTTLQNGNYVGVFRKNVSSSIEKPDMVMGSILVSQFGPENSDMINSIIGVNQHTPGQINLFSMQAAIIKDKIVVLFNDNISNENITSGTEPKLFDPYPFKLSTTATYAVTINSSGNVKRYKLATISSDDIVFNRIKLVTTDENLVVNMQKNPKGIENNFASEDKNDYINYLLVIE